MVNREKMNIGLKRFICYSLLLLIISVLSPGIAQDSVDDLNTLKKAISDVTIKDVLYKQSFQEKSSSCIVSFKVLNTDNQKEEEYECNLSDLNAAKTKLNATRQSLKIECATKDNKNIVRVYEDGKIKKYTSSFEFYASDVENGKLIVEKLQNQIRFCSEIQNDVSVILGNSPDINNSIDFLQSNIKTVEVNETSYDQSFKVNTDFPALCTIEITNKSDGKTSVYSFNASDINPSKIDFETKNEFVYVEGQTKSNIKLIEVHENQVKENYTNSFQFYVDDIEEGRKLKNVLELYVKESEQIKSGESAQLESISSLAELNEFFKTNFQDVTIDDDNYNQSFSFDDKQIYLSKFEVNNETKNVSESYFVNLADLNKSKTDFSTSGKSIKIELETNGRENVVLFSENDVPKKYVNKISLWAPDIEKARLQVENLKMMAEKATEIYKPQFIGSDEKPTKEQCLQFLNNSFSEVLQGDDTFKLELKPDEQNSCQLVYHEKDIAKDKIFEYKFNMNDINIQKINYDTKGLEVFINFETKGGKKFIEILEQGTEKGYDSKMELKVPDIEKGRLIIEAYKNLAQYCAE